MPITCLGTLMNSLAANAKHRHRKSMIIEPEFVVCDEPISALDVSVQAQVINLLDELKASMGLTLLFIAHDLSMVRYVSDRMAVMYMGVIVESVHLTRCSLTLSTRTPNS